MRIKIQLTCWKCVCHSEKQWAWENLIKTIVRKDSLILVTNESTTKTMIARDYKRTRSHHHNHYPILNALIMMKKKNRRKFHRFRNLYSNQTLKPLNVICITSPVIFILLLLYSFLYFLFDFMNYKKMIFLSSWRLLVKEMTHSWFQLGWFE